MSERKEEKPKDKFYVDPISLKEEEKNTKSFAPAMSTEKLDLYKAKTSTAQLESQSLASKLEQFKKTAEIKQNAYSELIDPYIKWENIAASGIIMFTMFATWFLTRFNFSLVWFIPLLSTISSVYQNNIRRIKLKAKNESKKSIALQEMDNDKESVEWFNSFLTRFWQNYEPGLSLGIKNSIDLNLEFYKPSSLDELRLTMFTLGSEGPRIESIKTFPNTDQETLIMDMDLSFIPADQDSISKNEQILRDVRNVQIELLAKVGPIPFQVSVRDFTLMGTMRVAMKFMNEYPHIKVVDIGFVDKPVIDFILKPLGTMDINKIGGLGDYIKETVQFQMAAMMVNPIKMSFPIGEWMGANFGATELPIGVLRGIID
jgi:Ca2+-dependent lipid-binding protein